MMEKGKMNSVFKKIDTKLALLSLVALLGLGLGYYVLVYRPQELRLRCLQMAKYESTNRYSTGKVFIEDATYQKCLKEFDLAK